MALASGKQHSGRELGIIHKLWAISAFRNKTWCGRKNLGDKLQQQKLWNAGLWMGLGKCTPQGKVNILKEVTEKGTKRQIKSIYFWLVSFHRQDWRMGWVVSSVAEVAQCLVCRLALNPIVSDAAHFLFPPPTVPDVWLLSSLQSTPTCCCLGGRESFLCGQRRKLSCLIFSYTSLRFGEICKKNNYLLVLIIFQRWRKKINGLLNLPWLALSYTNYFLKRKMCCLKKWQILNHYRYLERTVFLGECGQDSCISLELEFSFIEAGTSVIKYCRVKGFVSRKGML